MKFLALLLLLLPGCAFFGKLVHGGTIATGAAAGGAVAGPAGAAGGALAGDWGGDLLAEQLTGTESVRVPAGSPTASQGQTAGQAIADAINPLPSLPGGDLMFWLIAIVAFVALGGPAWLRHKLGQIQDDRNSHKNRTATLEESNKRLRDEVDQIWDRLMDGKGKPPAP